MMCEVQLYGIEEILVRIARELRPALTLSNPSCGTFSDGAHASTPRP